MTSSPSVVATCDLEGRILSWTERPEGSFGHGPSELVGRALSSVIPGLNVSSLIPGEMWPPQGMLQDPAGMSIPVRMSAQPVLDGAGRPLVICCVIEPATDGTPTQSRSEHSAERARGVESQARLPVIADAGQALRESEERLRGFVENAQGVIWIHDVGAHVILYVSPQYEPLWGRPASELYADIHAWLEAIHPEDRERVRAEFTPAPGRERYEAEYRVVRPDGNVIWIHDRGFPIRDERGEVVRIAGFAEDITPRKNTERVLRQWADAFTHCAHGISMGEPVGNTILVCNPAFARLFRSTPEQLAGMSIHEIYAPSEHPRLAAWFELADREASARCEALMARADGSTFPAQVDLVSVRDAEGKSLYRIATIQDIEQRKRSEEQLRTLSASLQSAVEAASLGVWTLDVPSSTLWGNETLSRIWGFEPSQCPSADWMIAQIVEEDRERMLQLLQQSIQTASKLSAEFKIRRQSDGKVRWLVIHAQPETDARGKTLKMAGVSVDVTDQRTAGETLARSQKLEALGTLAGGIAHDFNNILQAILGNLDLGLAELSSGDPVRGYLQEIDVAARRASDLVRQILTFSRPRESVRRPVDVSAVVHEALQLLRATLPSSITIKTDAPATLPAVSADPSQVHQVLVNLATNAAYAIGRAPGSISISLAEVMLDGRSAELLWPPLPGRYVQLAVRDSGSGMDRETLSRVFDPFFTTKPPGEGTGLGLSVVHGIMRALGGGLSVASESGKGSVFSLYFPVAERTKSTSSPPPPTPRGQGQRVLFVDDERALALVGRQALSRFGYTVDTFVDPVDALAAFRANPDAYAAVITDLTMPKLSGFELAEAVTAERPQLPVLLMSGYWGTEEHARAQRLGIRTLIMKPVAFDTLALRLHLALGRGTPSVPPG